MPLPQKKKRKKNRKQKNEIIINKFINIKHEEVGRRREKGGRGRVGGKERGEREGEMRDGSQDSLVTCLRDYHQRIVIVFGDFHSSSFSLSLFFIFSLFFFTVSIVSTLPPHKAPTPPPSSHLHNFGTRGREVGEQGLESFHR